ncbi:OPT/YSL family transporter [Nonomuraea sp. PA05]|uniref:OPT/YSL family transporter n=1 Tax=Nonomuraea sp. PA05 TaxID=2604466 RepID=UPI00165282FE|nr:OPT/YSL family transporter [Nonomuraea sp. PA05]
MARPPPRASPGDEPPPASATGPRRPRRLTFTPIVLGLGLGSCLSALNVILAFKVGTGFGGAIVTVLLGGAVLRLLRGLHWRTLFLTYAIASGGTLAVTAIDTSIGAGLLSGAAPPPWPALIALGLTANLLGLLLGILLAPSIIDDHGLQYPALWPVIDLMHALTGERDHETTSGRQRLILIGAAVAAGLSFAATLANRASLPLAPGLSPYLAVSLSPMLFGLGMRISGTAAAWVGAGAAYSFVVWWLGSPQRAPAYIEHLASPWILAVGVGLLLGYACGFLAKLSAGKLRGWRQGVVTVTNADAGLPAPGRSRRRWKATLAGTAVLLPIAIAASSPWLPPTTTLILIALTPLFALLLNRVNAATGMAPVGVFQYLTLVVLALLHVPAHTTYLLIAFICCSALASAYYIEAAKVASTSPAGQLPARHRLFAYQAIGSLAGVATGIGLLSAITELGTLGTADFPAPASAAMNFLNTLLRGSTDYTQETTIFLVCAGVAGLALAWSGAMPTMLALGVLLPAATCAAILLGSLTRLALERRRHDHGTFAATLGSGLILGGGVANAALLPLQVLAS